jgi:cation diffusion facilitator family transporter
MGKEGKGKKKKLDKLYLKGLYLEFFTVGYNIIEATLSILFGVLAGSIALVGFGLDAVIESLAGGILIWRLLMHNRVPTEKEERFEVIAHRFVALTFFILGLYVLYRSITTLYHLKEPDPSWPGVAIAVASLIVMPVLAHFKKKVGEQIGSKALVADSKETMACWYLSIALLLGLVLNAGFGWWWADPMAGIVIVALLFKEGWEEWEEASESEDDDD